MLLSSPGTRSMSVDSIVWNIISLQPAVVDITKSITRPFIMLSKLKVRFSHSPPWSMQSHFVSNTGKCSLSYQQPQQYIFPLKQLTATTAKIRQKRTMMIVMLITLGMAKKRALTATLRPSFLLISRRDLRILRLFTTLNLSSRGVRHRYENIRIMKSRMFHRFLKQLFSPLKIKP